MLPTSARSALFPISDAHICLQQLVNQPCSSACNNIYFSTVQIINPQVTVLEVETIQVLTACKSRGCAWSLIHHIPNSQSLPTGNILVRETMLGPWRFSTAEVQLFAIQLFDAQAFGSFFLHSSFTIKLLEDAAEFSH